MGLKCDKFITNKMTLREFTCFPELPPYLRFHIITFISKKEFSQLQRVNHELYELCSGKLSETTILTYGSGITERLYEERVKNFFPQELIDLKNNIMSWQEFYHRVDKFDPNNFNKYIKDGNLLELQYVKYNIQLWKIRNF